MRNARAPSTCGVSVRLLICKLCKYAALNAPLVSTFKPLCVPCDGELSIGRPDCYCSSTQHSCSQGQAGLSKFFKISSFIPPLILGRNLRDKSTNSEPYCTQSTIRLSVVGRLVVKSRSPKGHRMVEGNLKSILVVSEVSGRARETTLALWICR